MIDASNAKHSLHKNISSKEKQIKPNEAEIMAITPDERPFTPSIKLIELEIPAEANAVKHTAIGTIANIGFKIVRSTSSNQIPVSKIAKNPDIIAKNNLKLAFTP